MGLINLYRQAKLSGLIHRAVDDPELLTDDSFWLLLLRTTWQIEEVRIMFAGYKTYIIAALTAALTLLHALGKIDDATFQSLLALLGAGGVATVAAKINRINTKL